MADNRFYNNQKVYVESEYDNIILVDPNKIVDSNGAPQDRLVNHEELVIYANLEAKIIPRSKLITGVNYDDTANTIRIARLENDKELTINFLAPKGKEYLDTSWTDQITGKDTLEGKGQNQTEFQKENKKVIKKIRNPQDTQLLGITRITVKMNPSYVPQVTIEMTDIQGRVLFEQGEASPYSAFMQLPYPLFTLTLKGYFGKAVKYELMLKDFNARFDPSDGNYKITTNYIARSHALLADIALNNLFAVPHMMPFTIQEESNTTADNPQQQSAQSDGANKTTQIKTRDLTRGKQKLNEVYSIYERKGLIDEGFPRLSLNELSFKLEQFNDYIMNQYQKEDMSVLSDIVTYSEDLIKFRKAVYGNIKGNWFNTNIDNKNVWLLLKDNQPYYYQLKGEATEDNKKSIDDKKKSIDELKNIIDYYNERLRENKTFGENGSYTISGKKQTNSEITNTIKLSDIVKRLDNTSKIDFTSTYKYRNYNKPNIPQSEIDTFELTSVNTLEITKYIYDFETGNAESSESLTFFVFGDNKSAKDTEGSFLSKISEMENSFNKKREDIEKQLSDILAQKIKSKDTGIGFEPTINNIMAVICASADAFMRLMDDVYDKAWEKRTSEIRKNAIINKPESSDRKNSVKSTSTDGKSTDTDIVYPWPQYYERQLDKDSNVEYVLKYPGTADSIKQTKGYLYDVWPEIEFVENYINSIVINEKEIVDLYYPNQLSVSNYIPFNPIEFPFSVLPYQDTTIIYYLYEIFERSYLLSSYNNLYRTNVEKDELISAFADIEFLNIKESVKNSPSLTQLLKERNFTYAKLLEFLQSLNGGQSPSYQKYLRGYFNTSYIESLVSESQDIIYTINQISENSVKNDISESSIGKIKNYLKNTSSNGVSFLDTYPLNNLTWLNNNLSNGSSITNVDIANSTTKSLFFDDSKKVFANFNNNDLDYQNIPLTNFNWIKNTPGNENQKTDFTTDAQVIDFYNERIKSELTLTEGYVDYGGLYNTTTNNLTQTQTTSLLNTPYFINAILKGVENQENDIENPYVGLGYLFLNSLPLSSLREKLKNYGNELETESDYMFATLTKFSSIHKLPYYWILKYGSIYHRYKKQIEENTDILDDIWENFNYVNAYDPLTNTVGTQYTIKDYDGNSENIIMKKLVTVYDVSGNTTGERLIIENGFYPKVINGIYKYFTGKNVFTGYTTTEFEEAYTNKKLKIGKLTNNSQIIYPQGYDTDNPTRTLTFNNRFQYFEISGNTDFVDYDKDWVLMVPSAGYLDFNQTNFECFKNGKQTKDIITDSAVYNGSARSLWFASNFGYFDNSLIAKPLTNQYINTINNQTSSQQALKLTSNQSEYTTIEEIFSVFTKDQLDVFETHFLNFCQPTKNYSPNVAGQIQTLDYFLGDINFKYDFNLEQIMKSLFMVQKPQLANQVIDAKNISINQGNRFISQLSDKLLNYSVVLKMGNVGNFNRRVFGSFTTSSDLKITNPIDFKNYINGSLPGDGSNISLINSKNIHKSAWDAMYLYVGNYSGITNMEYTNNGSYLTDFFIDMNVEFSETNIRNLHQIIKIYGGKKLNNPSITKEEFLTEFNNFLTNQKSLQSKILDKTLQDLRNDLPTITEIRGETIQPTLDGNVLGNELWYVFKNMSDKWVGGQDFKTRLIFEDMMFLDRANRPVGDKIIINIDELRGFLKKANQSSSVYTLIGDIAEKNHFAFMPVPTYNNFYGRNERIKDARPIPQNIPNNLFGTFMEVDVQDSRPKLLCIYVGKPSEYLDLKRNPNYVFENDAFDFTRYPETMIENSKNVTDYSKRNVCVGFNVDFGIRNQGIFKGVNLDMSQRKNIAPTFQVLADIGQQASGQRVAQQSMSLYSFYKSMSYSCSVTAMGNAMIQPTMYFNLRHVPMFYGPYLILNVTHDITTTDFITQFEGIRIPIFSLEPPTDLLATTNDMIKIYKTRVLQNIKKSRNELIDTTITPSVYLNDNIQDNSDDCTSLDVYIGLSFENATYSGTTLNEETVRQKISEIVTDNTNLSTFLLGLAKLQTEFRPLNNNLFNITMIKDWKNNITYIDHQICISINGKSKIPLAGFATVEDSIRMMNSYFQVRFSDNIFNQFLNQLPGTLVLTEKRRKAIVMADIWYRDWYFMNQSATNYQTYITFRDKTNKDSENKKKYDKAVALFENYIGE